MPAPKAESAAARKPSPAPAGDPRWQGFWRLADPKISITSAVCMLIGAATAATVGELNWSSLALLGASLFCMEVAKNAWGDVIDIDSGNDLAVAEDDRTDFSGGKRVLVDGLLNHQQTWLIAGITGGLGLAGGAMIVLL